MRCPSCGTENAPDSRFCGGCGARLGVSGQRLAPTQKISDDASFPSPRPATAGTGHAGHAGHAVAQPGAAPRLVPAPYVPNGPVPQQSLPPPHAINNAPPSVYPTSPAPRPPNGSTRQPPLRPPTQLDDPSLSMPMVARRPWGLIIVVLLLDLGLGIAGAWMLREGLDDEPSAPDAAPRSEASATLPSAVAAGAQGAPSDPRTASVPTGAATAPGTGSADPTTAGSATPGAGATGGSASPGTGATGGSDSPGTGAADPSPGTATATEPGAATATGSDAAIADKPARRHRTTVKKPTGAAPTAGPVDPYAPTAPRPDPLPRESK
jgi:zinc-ribbon domain